MSSIKKAYQSVVQHLQENKDKKVSSVLDEIIEMCSAKSAGGSATSFHRDEAGKVVAIRCSYFGKWFLVDDVEFGAKQGTASGYNPMSKEGVSNYTKQQREYAKAKDQLLQDVAAGEIPAEEVAARMEDLEYNRKVVIPHSEGLGFDTMEEALAELEARQ